MKTLSTLKMFLLVMVMSLFAASEVLAQVEIPKDNWTATAYRYRDWGMPEWGIDNDRTDESIFGMGGSASEGRWYMVDLGESYKVVKVKLEYLREGGNYIKGFDVYVTDSVYPVAAANAPGAEEEVVGELFPTDAPNITASVAYPEATKIQEVEFAATQGRYVWIVSNGPTSDWWEMHEFSVFKDDAVSDRSIKASTLSFYPNPVSGNGRLTVNLEKANSSLTISDVAGRVVFNANNLMKGENSIDLNLKTGLYMVSATGQQAKKLMVK